MTPGMSQRTEWTCSRCNVTATWMADSGGAGRPENWREQDGSLYCLGCRRDVAAEEVVDAIPEGSTAANRADARRRALIEFEIRRMPERANSKIAASCRTSVPAVVKARQRMGFPPPVASPGP
jgi:hypothetical protein